LARLSAIALQAHANYEKQSCHRVPAKDLKVKGIQNTIMASAGSYQNKEPPRSREYPLAVRAVLKKELLALFFIQF
jgi:hypothetical protein